MDIKETGQKSQDFAKKTIEKVKGLSLPQKIALSVVILALIATAFFGFKYMKDNKYTVLFSGLNATDSLTVTEELDKLGADSKFEGDSIYVLKDEVDKLRIQLSPKITGGSTGFELLDEGSSFGLTDEEFALNKQRIIQGELERTIETFPQVQDSRVHITQGQKSVFVEESVEGTAAVYITLKSGQTLSQEQVVSIASLVSASSFNIPKQNVEIIDQSMNLLSYGLFDDNGNVNLSKDSGLDIARDAEKQLNMDLERSIKSLLEPMFGVGKVSVSVNSNLDFDTTEITELVIDPNRVAINEDRIESTSQEQGQSGGTIDDNMSNQANDTDSNSLTENKEEYLSFITGQTETRTIKAQGEINRITASIAINGNLDAGTMRDVEALIANTVGMDIERGDNVAVVAMEFNPVDLAQEEAEKLAEEEAAARRQMLIGLLIAIIIIAIIVFVIFRVRKSKQTEEILEENEIDMINKQLEEMEQTRIGIVGTDDDEGVSLEDEVKNFSAENPEQVTEIINKWLND
ncbi:MAG: flagellar basal-body MS-ring/collar protein FliF [Peptostreptococcaceae bacterium]